MALSLGALSQSEIPQRMKTILSEREDLKKTNETLMMKLANAQGEALRNSFEDFDEIKLLVKYLEGSERNALVALGDSLKQKEKDSIIVLLGGSDKNIPILVNVSGKALEKGYKAGMIVKNIATYLEGSGGGRPDMASGAGKNKEKISSLLGSVKELLK